MYTDGMVYVLDSGESTSLHCDFTMAQFTHFDNPVVWQKTQRHELSLINVLATIESPFQQTHRFLATFQLLQPDNKYRMSLAISSQYHNYDNCPLPGAMRSIVITVCLSVRSPNSKTTRPNFTDFRACCLWPLLDLPLTELRYVSLCTSGVVDDVMFSHNGPMALNVTSQAAIEHDKHMTAKIPTKFC